MAPAAGGLSTPVQRRREADWGARDLAPEGSRVGGLVRHVARGRVVRGEQSCLDKLLEVVRHGHPAHAHRIAAVLRGTDCPEESSRSSTTSPRAGSFAL